MLSAVLPGAGQVYNKKIWKVSIIYLGFGATGYFFIQNRNIYNGLRAEYLAGVNDGKPDDIQLISSIDDYRKNRDIFAMAFVGVYALQIIDAAVDAHLFNFDVSDDLSLHWQPNTFYSFTNNAPTFGASIILKLR